MNIQKKCSICGCTDLEEVSFPYEAKLIKTREGLAGYANWYNLEENLYADTYICINCGHFEFFNEELAKLILDERIENEKTHTKIEELNNQILKNSNEIEAFNKQVGLIVKQLESLDITIRKSNELSEQKKELTEKINLLEKSNKSLGEQINSLKNN